MAQGLDCIVSRTYLLERVAELAKSRCLFGPTARANAPGHDPQYFYQKIDDLDELALEFNFCVYSPKEALLPARETLLRFDRTDGKFKSEVHFHDRPTAIVGVHPCDLHAIEMLDAVFTDGHPDPHYLARRENLFIVGVDCAKPCTDGVFCGDIGSNHSSSGFDVMLYPMFDDPTSPNRNDANVDGLRYGVVFGSDAGREWLDGGDKTGFIAPDSSDFKLFESYLAEKQSAFPHVLDADWNEVPDILEQSYDSLLWEATAKRCYSCGSCNLVCPTCYCFDIQDESELPVESGRRERTWDGCMLREFASVAGGHNFRIEAANRLRHRIFRKGTWIKEHSGHGGCVGCSRCDRACTAHISIKQILNQLSEEAHHGSH